MSAVNHLHLGDARPALSLLEAPEVAPKTKLQIHLDLFAKKSNKPGMVTVPATAQGVRALGMDLISSALAGVAIPALLAKKTTGKFWPFEVSIADIAKGKHSGDSEVFDAHGNFVQAKFDQMWARHDPTGKGYLTEAEINRMIQTNSPAKDAGRPASTLEFHLLMVIAGEVNVRGEKVLTRATLQRFYQEGFEFLADRHREATEGRLHESLLPLLRAYTGPAGAAMAAAGGVRVPLDGAKTLERLRQKKSIFPTILAAIKNRGAPQPSSPPPANVD